MTPAEQIKIKARGWRSWVDYYALEIAIGIVILSLIVFATMMAAINALCRM